MASGTALSDEEEEEDKEEDDGDRADTKKLPALLIPRDEFAVEIAADRPGEFAAQWYLKITKVHKQSPKITPCIMAHVNQTVKPTMVGQTRSIRDLMTFAVALGHHIEFLHLFETQFSPRGAVREDGGGGIPKDTGK